jgi:hypothetical protein
MGTQRSDYSKIDNFLNEDLWRMYGPTKEKGGTWRIKTSEE